MITTEDPPGPALQTLLAAARGLGVCLGVA